MLKIMEFVLLGAAVLVIAGLVFAGPKSAPPAEDQAPLGAAEPNHSDKENDGHTLAS
ncbi:MAG: hypothetical protein M1568_04625 [Acidobacteria bacterium]|jgi:hypothetical protein|nr:hypothetical protein [Acidobacteriota bacterium]